MTSKEEKAVEQRTRIREARFMLRNVADDDWLTDNDKTGDELRVMTKRLLEIEDVLRSSISVRKSRKP